MNTEKINQNLAEAVLASLGGQSNLEVDQIARSFSSPPQWENGHVALGCFIFSKELKKKPVEIASELAKKLNESSPTWLDKAVALGPYLNFFLNFDEVNKVVLGSIIDQSFFKQKYFERPPVTMVEYSQPNTHKELHVGHMRNLCLGNALVRIFRYCQIETVATTYPGDVGTHVAKTLWYLKHVNKEPVPAHRKGAWLGHCYTLAHNLLEDQLGTEKEEQNRKELAHILKQIKNQSGEYYVLWKETRQWSIDLMKDVYKWADVQFDHWFFESEVDKSSLVLVDEYLKKGIFIEDQGAIGIDLKEEKLGFCLLRKSDGNGLYATKDLELARRKFEEYHIDQNIYVVDKRQSLHFAQVFKTLEKMGFEKANLCHHLAYDFVELPDGAMSSRKGNIVALQELIDRMENKITTDYLDKYRGSWSDEEIHTTATQIANGAIKYGMCRYDPQKKIVFDMEEWLKLDGNSGPYLQYTYARICSIISKLEKKVDHQFQKSSNLSLLTEDLEHQIVLTLSKFPGVVQQCAQKMTPHTLCNYLYEICQLFNRYYAEFSISKSEEDLQNARLCLVQSFANTIQEGLSLLGIQAPQKM
ncbi:MAG: arginine--tRNA ligase [Halobacteriovoraceae bacterium]|nr:arginine--tRNA ligase [Halobacteriovoraceae bacterium]